MHPSGTDPVALGFTVLSLTLALEEALKALAEKNGNQPGSWLDEVQELAVLRATARLTDSTENDAANAAIGKVQAIFERMRAGFATNKRWSAQS
jgi:hypothetical protein